MIYVEQQNKDLYSDPIWKADNTTMMNGIGNGTYAAALEFLINIGSAVYDITTGKVSANIVNMPLNCLIFQDDIAKIK